jgi:hypothetical protein
MQKFIVAAAMAAGLVAGPSASKAAPLGPIPQAPQASVIEVRDLCGVGWRRDLFGYCRPNIAYGPYYAPQLYYAPEPYPTRCWWTAEPYGGRRVCAW